MSNLIFGILGYGIVGKATHKGLLNNSTVIIHDTSIGTSIEDLYICNYVFFCIPTDTDASIQLLINNIRRLKVVNPTCKIVIRSTLPVGTCRMGTGDDAVVDALLRVHGLRNLRVVDASVMPQITSANTNLPIIRVAEKAADIVQLAWR